MRPIIELVNNMSMSDVVDYLIEMEEAFVVTKGDINKLKADAVKEVMLNCEAFWSDNLGTDVFKVSDIDGCIEKFEKGAAK